MNRYILTRLRISRPDEHLPWVDRQKLILPIAEFYTLAVKHNSDYIREIEYFLHIGDISLHLPDELTQQLNKDQKAHLGSWKNNTL